MLSDMVAGLRESVEAPPLRANRKRPPFWGAAAIALDFSTAGDTTVASPVADTHCKNSRRLILPADNRFSIVRSRSIVFSFQIKLITKIQQTEPLTHIHIEHKTCHC